MFEDYIFYQFTPASVQCLIRLVTRKTSALEIHEERDQGVRTLYTCLMDMTKAFDLVKQSLLFKKLISAGLSTIFVRLLLYIYMNQYANVRWNGSFSSIFSIKNGVRQEAILSGILYCFYTNDLFRTLRNNKTGCWVITGNVEDMRTVRC